MGALVMALVLGLSGCHNMLNTPNRPASPNTGLAQISLAAPGETAPESSARTILPRQAADVH
jgi:hypothetical protein